MVVATEVAAEVNLVEREVNAKQSLLATHNAVGSIGDICRIVAKYGMVLRQQASFALVLLDIRKARIESRSRRQHGALIMGLRKELRAEEHLVAATFALLLIA